MRSGVACPLAAHRAGSGNAKGLESCICSSAWSFSRLWLVSTVSDVTGTKEMNEVSMAVKTPQGLVVIVGCSYPGIEKILEAAVKIEPQVYSVFGGFQLAEVADPEVSSLVTRFRDKWKFERIAAGHCTGEFAFSEFNRVYGAKYDRAVVGAVIALPR